MRVTVRLRNTDGLKARMLARTTAQRQAIRAEMGRSSVRVFAEAQSLTPRDTGFMQAKLRRNLTRNGFNYVVGWYAADFIGAINPRTLRPITYFYPLAVVYGSRFMGGRDPLTPALEKERPIMRANIVAILEGKPVG